LAILPEELDAGNRPATRQNQKIAIACFNAQIECICLQLVAGFTLAQAEGSEAMWRERAEAVRVVKRSDRYAIFSGSLSGGQMKWTRRFMARRAIAWCWHQR
jgi:hypothetical protein